MSLSKENDRQEQVAELEQSQELLEGLPFFSGVSSRVLKLLSFLCERGVYAKGDTIVSRGEDPGIAVYVVKGEVVMIPPEESGIDSAVGRFGEGDFFGGLSLFGPMPSLFTLKAAEKTELMLLNRNQFQSVVEQFPDVSPQIFKTLLSMIRSWEGQRLSGKGSQDASDYGITML